ncbi:MAG: chromosome segregation protein SMC, partial [Verrucomicrobia bacterium]|nr:chromosome segregation protein SMC [Verrucomicrobiota bacterium]
MANVAVQKLNAQTQRGTVEQRQQRLKVIQQELERAAREQDKALEQQAGTRSRLNVLEQLEASHEGFNVGPLTVLKKSHHVLGSLADKIRVPNQYVTAIETALGHNLQLVLTEQPESAQQILGDLNASKAGRASVAPLAFLGNGYSAAAATDVVHAVTPETSSAPGPTPTTSAVELNGEPLPANSVVESEASVAPLLQRLLGTTRIVRDLNAATVAWRESKGTFHYVTLGGELLSRHGIYTGGYVNGNGDGKAPASILGRKNQIADLRSALAGMQQQVAEISRSKGVLQSEQTELQAGLQQAQLELRAQEVAIATHEGEFNALQNSQRLLHQKIDTVVY